MKLIILAAGKGSRLMPLTRNTPKMLIDLGNGMTLLETQLRNIEDSGVIDEVVIITGYCSEQVEAKLKNYHGHLKIKTVHNPLYEVSNNLITLWIAKHEMNGDFLITNGDNIFSPDVFEGLVKNYSKKGIYLTTRKKEKYYSDDMKIILGEEGIERVSKSINNEDANAESVGLVLISGEKNINLFRDSMEELVRDTAYTNKFWLEIFNRMSEKGIPIRFYEISGENKWFEVDFHGDMAQLLKLHREYKIEGFENSTGVKEVSNPDFQNNVQSTSNTIINSTNSSAFNSPLLKGLRILQDKNKFEDTKI